ncbi:hypothetical protein MES4922_160113 [Mesorhizobium ventifaucium]|uniref:Uncharacterized protein n=1 Tax=Mesorhizobium ventifaucium TaxID=666020 RepID=A0ABM9DI48_9HYPH|nr:hypothetical protein MES4922_160113 [Mesorhizobium ventifaucium]
MVFISDLQSESKAEVGQKQLVVLFFFYFK